MKILSWNIGKLLEEGKSVIYQLERISDYVANLILEQDPDIIFLQECSTSETYNQCKVLSETIGYKYYSNFVLDKNHNTQQNGFHIGLGLISKFKLENIQHLTLYNPKIKVKRPNGEIWLTHNKGFQIAKFTSLYSKKSFVVLNLHLIPLIKFKIEPKDERITPVWDQILKIIGSNLDYSCIIGGDFNISKIENCIDILEKELVKVQSDLPTTNEGFHHDYFLLSNNLDNKPSIAVIFGNNKLDHFPITLKLFNV